MPDAPFLKKRVYDLMEKKLIEYNASWIQPARRLNKKNVIY